MVSTNEYTVEAHSTWAPFNMIPDVHRTALGASPPAAKGIVKFVYVRATAAGGVHGFAAPVTVDGRETDISGEYAQRVSPKLAIGVGTAYLSTKQTYTVPGLGVVTHMKSHPGTLGGRIGAIYRVTDKLSAGATYDNYMERVSRSAPAFGIPSSMESFHSTGWHVGVAYWHDEKTTVLFDRQDINVVGAGANLYRGAWHGGIERTAGAWAFRAGAYGDRLTGGIGWRGGRWDVSWAFSGKPDKDVPGMGAGVSHGLRVATTL